MPAMSSEIELKFRIPARHLAAVRRAVATRGAVVEPLAAAYFDTPDELLARNRVALRLRCEGERWVQTLKAEGQTTMQRLEHNVALPGADRPRLDIGRHQGSAAGAVLARVLDGPGGAAPTVLSQLTERYATAVQRTRRVLRSGGALIELALDEGRITAGAACCTVCEIELELLQGSPQALLDLAGRWVDRFGLVLDVRSKSERGALLARGLGVSPPALARPLVLAQRAGQAQAFAALLANPLGQVLANASQLADPPGQQPLPEHLHQLRVGLRRLRSVLRVFGGLQATVDVTLAPGLAALFGQLGAARDRDVMAEWLWPALQAAGAPPLAASTGGDAASGGGSAASSVELTDLLGAPATQRLWLALLGLCQPPQGAPAALAAAPAAAAAPDRPEPPEPPEPKDALRQALRAPLRALYRQVRRDAAGFDQLDDAARHRLRRRIKRLRYATELSAALWPDKAVARLLRGLARVQTPLGDFNDTVVALAYCRAQAEHDPHAWFAVGWLSARRQALAPACGQALADLPRMPDCWRRR
jgi:inorganic triphosphatase YgiF